MKTSCLIRTILLAGFISLTLASCGGGGGGGESSSSGNDSTTNTPNTQKGYAPYNLSGCTMTYNYDGKPYSFEFDASGKVNGKAQLVDTVINYTGTYTYSRSSDGQNATLVLNTTSGKTSSGIEKTQTFDIELSFSSSTQATALVSYTSTDSVNGNGFHENEDVYSVTATFSGAGVQDNGSSDGESNDDTTSDDSTQLAPDSLPVGTVLNLHANGGTITSYTLNSDTSCTNNSGGKLTWEYSVTGDNTAEWVARNALNIPLTYKLVFTSATGGTYTYVNAGGEASVSGSFNLSDKSDAPSQGNDSEDTDDESNDNDSAIAKAPDAFPVGKTLVVWKNDGKVSNYTIKSATKAEASETKLSYTYKKLEEDLAIITFVNDESKLQFTYTLKFANGNQGLARYDSSFAASFSADFEILSKPGIEGNRPEIEHNISEDELPKVRGTAPDSLAGYVIHAQSYSDATKYYITGEDEAYIKASYHNASTGYYSGEQYVFSNSMFYKPSEDRKTAELYISTPSQWIGSVYPYGGQMAGFQLESTYLRATLYFDGNGNISRMEGTLDGKTLDSGKSVGVNAAQ